MAAILAPRQRHATASRRGSVLTGAVLFFLILPLCMFLNLNGAREQVLLLQATDSQPPSSPTTTINDSSISTRTEEQPSKSKSIESKSPKLQKQFETAYDLLPAMRLAPKLVARNPIDTTLQKTQAGVDISDPALYQTDPTIPEAGSRTATVMGMATGYDLPVFERFVGSLRKTGYRGHIILGVAPDVSPDILAYFRYRQVTPKLLHWQNCTYSSSKQPQPQCATPYLSIKTRWSRFPLQRDWLLECDTCTGPVLSMDIRDAMFQRDPFGPPVIIQGLMVYEEDASQRTNGHWLSDLPFRQCKGIVLDQVMLCSGTTIGTRVAMIKYLDIMYAEMLVWTDDPEHCRFGFHGDDQAIHNYLYYSGQLPFATAWKNRAGGIVNTIGVPGAKYQKQHQQKLGLTKGQARKTPFVLGANDNPKSWISLSANFTNRDGWFTEADGSLSRVVHQHDRFGDNIKKWMEEQDWFKDPMPGNP